MHKKIILLLLLHSILNSTSAENGFARLYPGPYCARRPFPQCCKGRDDTCSMDISTTKCYCDEFCVRRPTKDCCPDYESHCQKATPIIVSCFYNNQYLNVGQTVTDGCKQCTCTEVSAYKHEMKCTSVPSCSNLVEMINHGNFGWRAISYSFFYGNTLEALYRTRVGVCNPGLLGSVNYYDRQYQHNNLLHIRDHFDARTEWPQFIQPIHDQHDNPVSWAISTADVIADRMSIRTKGHDLKNFSAQNLIACVSQTPYCKDTDKAWQYVYKYGITTAECYPFMGYGSCEASMGEHSYTTTCINDDSEGYLYRMPMQYKVSPNENYIKYEIQTNGPVQAHLKVNEDFFYYQSGVYKHTPYGTSHSTRGNYIAVRIIGWGVEQSYGSNIKYWLCANSWGTQWGENGYFRILRGHNENEIESHVYGIWPVDHKTSKPLYEP